MDALLGMTPNDWHLAFIYITGGGGGTDTNVDLHYSEQRKEDSNSTPKKSDTLATLLHNVPYFQILAHLWLLVFSMFLHGSTSLGKFFSFPSIKFTTENNSTVLQTDHYLFFKCFLVQHAK